MISYIFSYIKEYTITLLRGALKVIIALIFVLSIVIQAYSKDFTEITMEALQQCQGRFKYKEPTKEELQEIINKHKEWRDAYPYVSTIFDKPDSKSDSRRANLCGAYLENAELKGINLDYADLSGAILLEADLTETRLDYTILPKVINCDYQNLMKTVSFSVIFYYTAISVFKIG